MAQDEVLKTRVCVCRVCPARPCEISALAYSVSGRPLFPLPVVPGEGDQGDSAREATVEELGELLPTPDPASSLTKGYILRL